MRYERVERAAAVRTIYLHSLARSDGACVKQKLGVRNIKSSITITLCRCVVAVWMEHTPS